MVRAAHHQVDFHVHQAGKHRHVPEIDLHRIVRHCFRRHAGDAVPFNEQVTRCDQFAADDVEHAGTDEVDGRLWRAWSCHVDSFAGG